METNSGQIGWLASAQEIGCNILYYATQEVLCGKHTYSCCSFWPANRCSACCLLVEIICFGVKTSISLFSDTNGKKGRKTQKIIKNKHKKGSNSFFWRFPIYFLSFFSVCVGKRWKTCFNAETNDFDQQMVCGAPVRWSKYTAYSFAQNLKISFFLSFYESRTYI